MQALSHTWKESNWELSAKVGVFIVTATCSAKKHCDMLTLGGRAATQAAGRAPDPFVRCKSMGWVIMPSFRFHPQHRCGHKCTHSDNPVHAGLEVDFSIRGHIIEKESRVRKRDDAGVG